MALLDFLSLRASIADLGAQVRGLRTKIEEKQREREDIANAPAARSDVKALYEGFLQQRAADYRQSLTAHLTVVRSKPKSFMPAVGNGFAKPTANTSTYLRVFTGGDDGSQTPLSMERAVCGLFGEVIKAQLFKVLDELPWEGEGLPMAARQEKLAKLDAEIEKLVKEENKLVSEARAAGVVIE